MHEHEVTYQVKALQAGLFDDAAGACTTCLITHFALALLINANSKAFIPQLSACGSMLVHMDYNLLCIQCKQSQPPACVLRGTLYADIQPWALHSPAEFDQSSWRNGS